MKTAKSYLIQEDAEKIIKSLVPTMLPQHTLSMNDFDFGSSN